MNRRQQCFHFWSTVSLRRNTEWNNAERDEPAPNQTDETAPKAVTENGEEAANENGPTNAETGAGDENAADKAEAEKDQPEPEPEEKQMTLAEWKALQAKRNKPRFKIRRAGEGEDPKQWQNTFVLKKKSLSDEEEEDEDGEEEEDDDEEEEEEHEERERVS